MRRIALLLAALAFSAGLAIVPTPASADVGICASTGTATTGAPLFTPIAPKATTTFAFAFTVGGCVSVPTMPVAFQATGRIHGWCGRSSGKGTTNNPSGGANDPTPGHQFFFTSSGTVLTATGELTGEFSDVPDATTGSSCLTGATRFLITGTFVLCHAGKAPAEVNTKDTKATAPCHEPIKP